MYPFVRLFKDVLINKRAAPLAMGETHVSHHICWPWDLDLWWELNNGRTLTIYDLGRIPMAVRGGLTKALAENKWGLTVAGSSVRYRRRVRMFAKIKMHSRLACWDDKFLYVEQSMWLSNGECSSHALFRTAITDKNGIVSPERVLAAMNLTDTSPDMPEWIKAWTEAEAKRPWPPMQD